MAKALPYMQFFVMDWLTDTRLRLVSYEARGVWMDLLCHMHLNTDNRGTLAVGGSPMTADQLARVLGLTVEDTERILAELEQAGVFSRDEDGAIYSRRIRADQAKRDTTRDRVKRHRNADVTPLKRSCNALVTPLKRSCTEYEYEYESGSVSSLGGGAGGGAGSTIWTGEVRAALAEFEAAHPKGRRKPAKVRLAFAAAVERIAHRHGDGFEGWAAAGRWLVDRARTYAGSHDGQRGQYTPDADRWLADERYDEPDGQWAGQPEQDQGVTVAERRARAKAARDGVAYEHG